MLSDVYRNTKTQEQLHGTIDKFVIIHKTYESMDMEDMEACTYVSIHKNAYEAFIRHGSMDLR